MATRSTIGIKTEDGTIRAISGTISQRNAVRLPEVSVRFDMWISTFLRRGIDPKSIPTCLVGFTVISPGPKSNLFGQQLAGAVKQAQSAGPKQHV